MKAVHRCVTEVPLRDVPVSRWCYGLGLGMSQVAHLQCDTALSIAVMFRRESGLVANLYSFDVFVMGGIVLEFSVHVWGYVFG